MKGSSTRASLEKGPFDPRLGNFSMKHANAWGYVRLDANASRANAGAMPMPTSR